MKFIAVILSIYFIGLTIVPCSDEPANADTAQTEVVVDHNTAAEHQHSDTDDCTPFCQCHCCHVHTIDLAVDAFQPIIFDISSNIFLHFDSLGENIPRTLLQPPRIPA